MEQSLHGSSVQNLYIQTQIKFKLDPNQTARPYIAYLIYTDEYYMVAEWGLWDELHESSLGYISIFYGSEPLLWAVEGSLSYI